MVDSLKKIALFLGSSFGFGWLPGMPGTWGTIPAVLITLAIYYRVTDEALFRLCSFGWLIMLCGLGYLVLPTFYEVTEESDPRNFALDEMAGYFIVPLILGRTVSPSLLFLGGFVSFRIFDIVKPPGARFFDRSLEGFLSVMGDDLISGLYAAFLLYLVNLLMLGNLWL